MSLDFDNDIRPFFQVLVKKVNNQIKAQSFFKKFRKLLIERSGSTSKHSYKIVKPSTVTEISEEHFFVAHIRHKQIPTWYKSPNSINLDDNSTNLLYDTENDLLVFYRKKNYVFIHTNCSQIFSLVNETQELLEENGIKFQNLTGQQINQVLTQFDMEYRSLGLQNHFGLGGTAPDGKAYYGRDTSNCLTPSFDAGYGFSFCIGRMVDKDGRSNPFGCSKTKSKIWTSWIEDLNMFCDQCDKVVEWLDSPLRANKQLEVLIQSTSKNILTDQKPVEFFLDYYVMEKGLVFIGDESGMSLDWYCSYDSESSTIKFEIKLQENTLKTEIKFSFNKEKEEYQFRYEPSQSSLTIGVAMNEERITARSSNDLVHFLNRQESFTILFEEPYAYRSGECWADNRLKRIFNKGETSIDWTDVNIKKENLDATPKMNILQKIEKIILADERLIFAALDNGANEIADYIALYESKMILIHAKYAEKSIPGLVIGDIQVVASQTVKNVRFFSRQAYTEKIIARLYKNATNEHGFTDAEKFKKKFFDIIQNKDTEFECWIVQPGISLGKLKSDPVNKMHTILNFVESILRVNSINFKLYCSP